MYNNIITAKWALIDGQVKSIKFTETFRNYLSKLDTLHHAVELKQLTALNCDGYSFTIENMMSSCVYSDVQFGEPLVLRTHGEYVTIQFIDELQEPHLLMMWDDLSHCPVNSEDLLEESWEIFEKDTDKFAVWGWFDTQLAHVSQLTISDLVN